MKILTILINIFVYSIGFRKLNSFTKRSKSSLLSHSCYTVALIIPTGIGASIGGFAGDGLPSAKLLSQVADVLITHPNVMNGASLYWPVHNVLYVEGYALDEFATGRIGLRPLQNKSQKIGLLLDKAIEKELRIRHLQVADAARATLGFDVAECVITSNPVTVESLGLSKGGASWGSIANSDALIEAAHVLKNKGCTAIAVVVRFPEDDEGDEETVQAQVSSFQQYRLGLGVDRIAGVEAIISHLITKELMLPCAHAPAFAAYSAESGMSAKACAEEIGYTYLPCVLAYLHRAPDLVLLDSPSPLIRASDVDAVVLPADALGGAAALAFLARGTLVVAVTDNKTAMKVTSDELFGQLTNSTVSSGDVPAFKPNVVVVRSYAEAAGILVAHKSGILFESITSHVKSISITEL